MCCSEVEEEEEEETEVAVHCSGRRRRNNAEQDGARVAYSQRGRKAQTSNYCCQHGNAMIIVHPNEHP